MRQKNVIFPLNIFEVVSNTLVPSLSLKMRYTCGKSVRKDTESRIYQRELARKVKVVLNLISHCFFTPYSTTPIIFMV